MEERTDQITTYYIIGDGAQFSHGYDVILDASQECPTLEDLQDYADDHGECVWIIVVERMLYETQTGPRR